MTVHPSHLIYIYISSSHAESMDSFDSLSPSIPIMSLLAGFLDGTQCLHKADKYNSLLISQHWCIHVCKSQENIYTEER